MLPSCSISAKISQRLLGVLLLLASIPAHGSEAASSRSRYRDLLSTMWSQRLEPQATRIFTETKEAPQRWQRARRACAEDPVACTSARRHRDQAIQGAAAAAMVFGGIAGAFSWIGRSDSAPQPPLVHRQASANLQTPGAPSRAPSTALLSALDTANDARTVATSPSVAKVPQLATSSSEPTRYPFDFWRANSILTGHPMLAFGIPASTPVSRPSTSRSDSWYGGSFHVTGHHHNLSLDQRNELARVSSLVGLISDNSQYWGEIKTYLESRDEEHGNSFGELLVDIGRQDLHPQQLKELDEIFRDNFYLGAQLKLRSIYEACKSGRYLTAIWLLRHSEGTAWNADADSWNSPEFSNIRRELLSIPDKARFLGELEAFDPELVTVFARAQLWPSSAFPTTATGNCASCGASCGETCRETCGAPCCADPAAL